MKNLKRRKWLLLLNQPPRKKKRRSPQRLRVQVKPLDRLLCDQYFHEGGCNSWCHDMMVCVKGSKPEEGCPREKEEEEDEEEKEERVRNRWRRPPSAGLLLVIKSLWSWLYKNWLSLVWSLPKTQASTDQEEEPEDNKPHIQSEPPKKRISYSQLLKEGRRFNIDLVSKVRTEGTAAPPVCMCGTYSATESLLCALLFFH